MSKTDYFASPALAWIIVLPAVVALPGILWLIPDMIPCGLLGAPAHFLKTIGHDYNSLMGIIFGLIVLVHIGEGICALSICSKLKMSLMTTLKWTLQTTILGFPSLSLILRHNAKSKRSKKQ